MHTYFFKHEFLRMVKLKKNYLFVISILLMMLVYIFFIMPNQQTIYTFDAKKTEQNVEDISYILKGMEEREGTGVGDRFVETDTGIYKKITIEAGQQIRVTGVAARFEEFES